MATPLRVLIIRFSSIGDIVLTTPVIRCVRAQYPNATIAFATKAGYATLVENNPHIDEVFTLEESFQVFKEAIRSFAPTHIIDLHHNIRSKRLYVDLAADTKSFPKLNREKWLLVNLKWDRLPKLHIVDRYFKAAEHLNIDNDQLGLDYFIPDSTVIDSPSEKEYLCFAIGGQHATKQLPTSRIIELLQHIPKPVVLLGGKDDIASAQQIKEASKKQNLYNFCGKLNLDQSALMVKNSVGLISHDTGMMHIGAALKKPILSLWGNTVPAFGMYPYFPKAHPAEALSTQFEVEIACRPCSKIGYSKCPKGHFKCMNDQNLGAIAQAALSLYSA